MQLDLEQRCDDSMIWYDQHVSDEYTSYTLGLSDVQAYHHWAHKYQAGKSQSFGLLAKKSEIMPLHYWD